MNNIFIPDLQAYALLATRKDDRELCLLYWGLCRFWWGGDSVTAAIYETYQAAHKAKRKALKGEVFFESIIVRKVIVAVP